MITHTHHLFRPSHLIFSVLLACQGLFLSAQEASLSMETATGTLYGTLLLPAGEAPAPVVFIHAGSGPTDRNGNSSMTQNNALKMLAEGLAEAGIASLRVDKRGIGESAGAGKAEEDLRITDFMADAKAWMDLLAKDSRFTTRTMLGHSEGALITLIASQQNDAVHAYISLCGPGISADQLIKGQMKAQPPMVQAMVNPRLDTLKQGDTLHHVPPMLFSLFRPGIQPYLISWFAFDPAEEIQQLEIPVLIIGGGKDLQVPAAHVDTLAAAYPRAETHIFPDMNHLLKPTEAEDLPGQLPLYSDPDLPLVNGLVDTLAKFIRQITP